MMAVERLSAFLPFQQRAKILTLLHIAGDSKQCRDFKLSKFKVFGRIQKPLKNLCFFVLLVSTSFKTVGVYSRSRCFVRIEDEG